MTTAVDLEHLPLHRSIVSIAEVRVPVFLRVAEAECTVKRVALGGMIGGEGGNPQVGHVALVALRRSVGKLAARMTVGTGSADVRSHDLIADSAVIELRRLPAVLSMADEAVVVIVPADVVWGVVSEPLGVLKVVGVAGVTVPRGIGPASGGMAVNTSDSSMGSDNLVLHQVMVERRWLPAVHGVAAGTDVIEVPRDMVRRCVPEPLGVFVVCLVARIALRR